MGAQFGEMQGVKTGYIDMAVHRDSLDPQPYIPDPLKDPKVTERMSSAILESTVLSPQNPYAVVVIKVVLSCCSIRPMWQTPLDHGLQILLSLCLDNLDKSGLSRAPLARSDMSGCPFWTKEPEAAAADRSPEVPSRTVMLLDRLRQLSPGPAKTE